MDDGNSSPDIPTDALVDILVRLPPNARRRVRLVCRQWREAVDERAPVDMRRRGAKILVVDSYGCTDVFSTDGSRTNLWRDYAMAGRYKRSSVVGTCNGILCLCNDFMPGGAITLANPSTGDAVSLPPLPPPTASVLLYEYCRKSWHQAYAFACHLTTGRYKVVHVPAHYESFWEPGTVHVFTLGEASWRDVEAGPSARCSPGLSSLAAVEGTLYWLTEDAGKIMSFDLDDDRVVPTVPLPVPVKSSRCRLTKVHARLGVAVGSDHGLVTVWVLEGEQWSRRYVVEVHGPRQLAVPHFAHGDYVLTHGSSEVNGGVSLYRHKMSGAARVQTGVVQIRKKDGEEVARLVHPVYRTFEYVETKESLRVYKTAFHEMGLW